jgi:hypothetical protein
MLLALPALVHSRSAHIRHLKLSLLILPARIFLAAIAGKESSPLPGLVLGLMDHLPATFLDGSPIEVRVEIFQSEPIRPVVQPGMPDRLTLADVTEGAIRDLEK